ncbi:endoribonuclease MazF [Glacieibacterium sp.]|uniref:endoribonuclease MazF n=1 Tax=Glacieibacterium sp. TaxID=2860237 RepID=UPI003B00EA48
MKPWTPDAGEIVWLHFLPQAGHEQAGHRPALVLSPAAYNGRTGLMLCCPLTTRIKGYPFEVMVPGDPPSVVLADQVRNLDWRARRAELKGRVGEEVLREVRTRIEALIG